MMRTVRYFLLVFVLLLFGVGTALANDENLLGSLDSGQAIRIVFVANTRGLTEPCPVCGQRALGGLARRARILHNLYNDDIPTIYLTGPYEWRGNPLLEAEHSDWKSDVTVSLWKKAQDLFPPSIGYMASDEAKDFEKTSLPKGYVTVPADQPVVKKLTVRGHVIAVVLFPELKEVETATDANIVVSDSMIKSVMHAGQKVADADLVIGISPWGAQSESRVLRKLNGVYDVILGAGPGAFLTGEIPDFARGIIWTRTEVNGRSLMELVFHNLKQHVRPYGWVKDIDFTANEYFLGKDIRDYPKMRRVLTSTTSE